MAFHDSRWIMTNTTPASALVEPFARADVTSKKILPSVIRWARNTYNFVVLVDRKRHFRHILWLESFEINRRSKNYWINPASLYKLDTLKDYWISLDRIAQHLFPSKPTNAKIFSLLVWIIPIEDTLNKRTQMRSTCWKQATRNISVART